MGKQAMGNIAYNQASKQFVVYAQLKHYYWMIFKLDENIIHIFLNKFIKFRLVFLMSQFLLALLFSMNGIKYKHMFMSANTVFEIYLNHMVSFQNDMHD